LCEIHIASSHQPYSVMVATLIALYCLWNSYCEQSPAIFS